MIKTNCIRMRSDSCPEPLEKQKTKPLKIDYNNIESKPIMDKEWITNLLNKYFSKKKVTE